MSGLDPRVRRALRVTGDVLRALDGLHRAGVAHGGVFPGAVVIRGDRGTLRPPSGPVPPEYRDPERARALLRDPSGARRATAREDVYGAGALLYQLLEGGPPPCGPGSRLTRPAPPGVAFLLARSLSDGAARYPDPPAMRRDLDVLLRRPESPPERLPSFSGGRPAARPDLVPFEVRTARRRRYPAVIVAILLAGGIAVRAGLLDPAPGSPPGFEDLLASYRAALDDRLRAAGEGLPADAPLLLVADARVPGDVPWPVLDDPGLAWAAGEVLRRGGGAAEVHAALLRARPEADPPVVLWLSPGGGPDETRVVLCYRGVALSSPSP
jgi:hypothetical protein